MFRGPFALALAAGMAAVVNPCGFAMLPAYLSTFLGSDPHAGGANAVGRALRVSAALTGGFVAVFGIFGLIVTPFALSIKENLPWVTITIGVGLFILGISLLGGREITLRIPKLQKGGRDGSILSMFLFGVSYATASLSCTIGPFLAVTTSTFRSSSLLAGTAVFFTYAVGMGVVISILTVALALAKNSVVDRFRRLLPIINRISGALLIVAGAYVAYYGWYEIRIFKGPTTDPIIDRAIRIQVWLQNQIVPDNPIRVAIVAITILGVLIVSTRLRRRQSHIPSSLKPHSDKLERTDR